MTAFTAPRCTNVRISDCDISAGDDAIAITSIGDPRHHQILGGDPLGPGKTENVTVTNCTLQSRSTALRVGYTGGDVKNCTFSNIVIRESNRGLLVNVRDEASVENLLFSNITIQTRLHTGHWWGHAEPIQVSAIANDPGIKKLGQIKNVRFSNIIAESQSGIVVWGRKDSVIKDLAFDNVKVKITKGPLTTLLWRKFRPADKRRFCHRAIQTRYTGPLLHKRRRTENQPTSRPNGTMDCPTSSTTVSGAKIQATLKSTASSADKPTSATAAPP